MAENNHKPSPACVIVVADVDSNAQALVERMLQPAGINAYEVGPETPKADILVVDVTQMRGDPMADLRELRESGEDAPAIVLAAHFPHSRLRDMFRLGVNDFLLKPYRQETLCEAIRELHESRTSEGETQILAEHVEVLQEQVERRTEEIRLLSEIGRVVVSLKDLDAILRRVVEAAAFMTEAEEASIYLAEPDTNDLVLRANKHAGERYATLQRLRVQDTLVGEVFSTGNPILRRPSMEGGPVKVQTGFLVKSLVKVPLFIGDEIIGVLGIYNRIAPRAFTDHHLILLIALAHWAGAALEFANLIHQNEASSPTEQVITAAPISLIDGLEQAILDLETLLGEPSGDTNETRQDKLRQLQKHLKALRALPIATLDAYEAQEMIDLPELIHQIKEEMQSAVTRKKLEMISEVNPTMPLFRGDSGGTKRVLSTLVASAIRRTNEGRVVLEARRIEVQDGNCTSLPIPREVQLDDGLWVVVRVSDTGPSLSSDMVLALTEPSPDPTAGQIGLGLSLGEIRMMLESMGGVIWYEHTPASTSIIIALPITIMEQDDGKPDNFS